jgi:hypothetical protein
MAQKFRKVTSFDENMSLTLETPIGPKKGLCNRQEEWIRYLNQDDSILFKAYAYVAVHDRTVFLQICGL